MVAIFSPKITIFRKEYAAEKIRKLFSFFIGGFAVLVP